MTDVPADSDNAVALERARQLFRFLKAFSERTLTVRRTLGEQEWSFRLDELPQHESIRLGQVQNDV